MDETKKMGLSIFKMRGMQQWLDVPALFLFSAPRINLHESKTYRYLNEANARPESAF